MERYQWNAIPNRPPFSGHHSNPDEHPESVTDSTREYSLAESEFEHWHKQLFLRSHIHDPRNPAPFPNSSTDITLYSTSIFLLEIEFFNFGEIVDPNAGAVSMAS